MRYFNQSKSIIRSLFFVICLLVYNNNSYSRSFNDSISRNNSKQLDRIQQKETQTKKSFSVLANRASEFTDAYIASHYANPMQENPMLGKAQAVCKAIDDNEQLVATLEPTSLTKLPIGIKNKVGNVEYLIGISDAKFTPDYTEITAFVRIKLPQIDANGKRKELFFGSNQLKLSHKGGLVGDSNLTLLGDFPIKISGDKALLILKGGMDMSTGLVNKKTYVTIDCNGFKELGIEADVEFSNTLLQPVGSDNKVLTDPNARVKGTFKTKATNWNDILADVSLSKFQVTSFPGTIFELQKAVIDLSDLRNGDNIQWPKDYQKDYLVEGSEALWRGVYIANLTVILPEQFKKKNSNERITMQATNMLIDQVGVSGDILGKNVLSLEQGSASGWQFSVDSFSMNFRANSLTGAGFGGKIVLPVSNKATANDAKSAIDYTAVINPIDDEYTLNAKLQDDISFNLFKAKANLQKDSYIEMKVKEGKFLPKAFLNGNLTIKGSNSQEENDTKSTVDFKGIVFQELELQTVVPYIKAKYFGYQGEVKVANFPVTISDIGFVIDNTSASLEFNLAINLMENQFNGATRLAIVGKFGEEEGIQKWKFDRLRIEKIYLKADIGGAKFEGSIALRNDDPVYGDGFAGNLKAEFKGGIIVEANAIFGKKDDFRYWYVDAMVDGLNIPCGAFVFKGFGGGAYYRMKKAGFSSSFTASGSQYVPDINSSLGIKAMIHFANAAKPDAFWGGAGFEIAFNRNGGMNRISIYGEGHVMQDFGFAKDAGASLKEGLKSVSQKEDSMDKASLDKLKESNLSEAAKQVYPDKVSGQQGLNAFAAIEYDFTTSTLHGSFDLYVNVVGGLFKGRGAGDRAGWAVLHFAPNSWYVRMGTPTDRLGLKIGIGSIAVEAGGYFMIGDDIPASPPPPAIVAQILGVSTSSLNYMRKENDNASLGSGKGFAFGSDFSFSTGDLTFLIFYANFKAGFGFDIMVKDYGDAQCKGSGQIGINGWYASGQSYAYFQGELGVKFRLFGRDRQLAILKAGAAVVLQAKLPNPVWIKGIMGGNYSLLGGLIEGRFRFEVEFGSQCEFLNPNPLQGINAIADIKPDDAAKKVDVFAIPQVGFNMAIGKNFTIDDEGAVKTFRAKLEDFSIKKEGVLLPNNQSWNKSLDLVSYNSVDVLPPNSNLKMTVKVSFQEWINGSWQTIYDNGQIAMESKEVNFETGDAPNYIPVSNVNYCYPVFDQKYVYQKESAKAYVALKQGQPYLFDLKPGQSQKAFYKTGNNQITSNLSYDKAKKQVTIDLPTLLNKKAYALSLMTLESKTDANANLTEGYQSIQLADSANVNIKSNTLNEIATGGQGIEMLAYNFNTSEYNTFSDKMVAKKPKQTLVDIIYTDVHALESVNNASEPFDMLELTGSTSTLNKPLVQVEAILEDNYFISEIQPLIYNGYPLENDLKLDRDTSILGVPPTKAIETLAWYEDYLINNPTSFMLKEFLPYRYNLPFYYKLDFKDIRYKIVNKYVNTNNTLMSQKYNYIIKGEFPYIKQGPYKVKLSYVLPGGQLGTTSIFTMNKPN
jgi:hypothetical protein